MRRKGKQYFKFNSLTFWAGAALIVAGLILGIHEEVDLGPWADVLDNWVGSSSPGLLIGTGLGFVGIRRAIEDRR